MWNQHGSILKSEQIFVSLIMKYACHTLSLDNSLDNNDFGWLTECQLYNSGGTLEVTFSWYIACLRICVDVFYYKKEKCHSIYAVYLF